MKSITINVTDKMAKFLDKAIIDSDLEFKRNAFLLYPYIEAGVLSHAGASDLLGIKEKELIEFYKAFEAEHGDEIENSRDFSK